MTNRRFPHAVGCQRNARMLRKINWNWILRRVCCCQILRKMGHRRIEILPLDRLGMRASVISLLRIGFLCGRHFFRGSTCNVLFHFLHFHCLSDNATYSSQRHFFQLPRSSYAVLNCFLSGGIDVFVQMLQVCEAFLWRISVSVINTSRVSLGRIIEWPLWGFYISR
jgi:hypothetical protein